MKVEIYQHVDEFLQQAQPYLEKEEAFNNLPLGVAGRLRQAKPDQPAPLMATVADSQLALVALMTPPHSLILYGDRPDPQPALDALAAELRHRAWHIPGAFGAGDLPLDFARTWDCTAEIKMQLRVYRLTAVGYTGDSPGILRPFHPDEKELAMAWTTAFNRDIDEDLGGPDEVYQHVEGHLQRQTLFCWEVAGQPVSMAARTRPTRHGEVINDVYTPPEFRRRGHATSLVAALSQRLLDEGKAFCALFTDLANPTSNNIYQKVGYKPLGDFMQTRFMD